MATSYVHPVARFPSDRLKFRPKLVPRANPALRRQDDAVTADRTPGVGSPVTDEAIPATDIPSKALVREAIETALDSLEALERQAHDVARRFRRHALPDANLGLSHLVQSTQTLLRLAVITATATGTSVEEVCEAHGITAPADTNIAVTNLIREQLAEDWNAVATVIEQRFLSALAGWRRLFETLGGSAPDPYGTAA